MLPKCDCCLEINSAIKKHRGVVKYIINSHFAKARRDRPSLWSDGMEALWQALLSYDKAKCPNLGSYLCTMVHQRIIDGLRSREGRSQNVKNLKSMINDTYPMEDAHDEATDFEWDNEVMCFGDNEIETILSLAEEVSPTLPTFLGWRVEGYTVKEVCSIIGCKEGTYHTRMVRLRKSMAEAGIARPQLRVQPRTLTAKELALLS